MIGRAIVIGGSVGGLMAANLLYRRGWQVDVFERVAEGLASRGAGIARHVELEDIMRAAGADPGAPVGIEVAGRSAFDRGGRLLDYFPYPQYLTAWALVFSPDADTRTGVVERMFVEEPELRPHVVRPEMVPIIRDLDEYLVAVTLMA